MTTPARRTNGPLVALALALLCLAAFLATLWNYTRTHPFSTSAVLIESGEKPIIKATFHEPIPPIGQRVVLKITGDQVPARGGTIVQHPGDGIVLIAVDTPVTAPPGSTATANIDGTVGPVP